VSIQYREKESEIELQKHLTIGKNNNTIQVANVGSQARVAHHCCDTIDPTHELLDYDDCYITADRLRGVMTSLLTDRLLSASYGT
jgi:hypothetical protein